MPTTAKAITDFFDAVEDPDSLKPADDIARIEKALQEDLPLLETLDLKVELDKLHDTSAQMHKLENAFVKGFPGYAKSRKVSLDVALNALEGIVDEPVITRIRNNSDDTNGTAKKATNGRVTQDQLVAWMEDQTEAFTYADIEEANGCGRSSAERAVKAVRDRLEETTKGRSKAFIWNG